MISHQRAQELISARLDQPLDPIDNRELLSHLATCPICQRFAEQSNVLARGLRDLPHLPASPSVNRQVLERISAGRSSWSKLGQIFSPSRSPVAVATAALIVIAIAAFAVILRSGVEPQSHVAAPAGVTATYQAQATATQASTLAQATTPTPTPTAIATATQAPTVTATAPPTPTQAAPTAVAPTSAPPTANMVATAPPPTAPVPTATPTSGNNIAPVNRLVPTATEPATAPPTATSTPLPPTAAATATPEPTATATEIATATATAVPTATETPTEVPTEVPTDVPTETPTPTEVPTEPLTVTTPEGGAGSPVALPPQRHRPTATPTEVPTSTPSPTPVPTATATPTQAIQPVSGSQGASAPSNQPIAKQPGDNGTGNSGAAPTTTPPAIVPRDPANQTVDPPAATATGAAQSETQASAASPVTQPTNNVIEAGNPPAGHGGTATTIGTTPTATEGTATSGGDIAEAEVVAKLPNGSSAPAGPLQVAVGGDAVVILGPGGAFGIDELNGQYYPLGSGVSRGIWSPKGILLLVSYAASGDGSPSIAVFDRDTGSLTPITQQAQDQPVHRDVPAGWIGQNLYYLRTFIDQGGRVELHQAYYDGSNDHVIWSSDQLGLQSDQPIPTGDGFLIATDSGWLLIGEDGHATNLGGGSGGTITQGTVSPNGDLVAYENGGQLAIAPAKSPGSPLVTLPYSGADGTGYSWSPSGRYIAISDGQALHIYANDGTPLETVGSSSGGAIGAPRWLSDGLWFIVPGDPATIRRISNDSLNLPS